MKKLLLAIALVMFLAGFAYGQSRQCDTSGAICSMEIVDCRVVAGTCPTGQCGNPDQAGCCIREYGICYLTNTVALTVVCGNSCNP